MKDTIVATLKATFRSKRFWAGAVAVLTAFGFATGAVTVETIGNAVCAVATCTD